MARALVAFLCLLACVLAAPRVGTLRSRRVHGRIINGTEANIADFPWVVLMEMVDNQSCGASIISTSWALTSAHCVYGLPEGYFRLRAGSSLWGSGGVVLDVSSIILHDAFDDASMDYDFAVMQGSEPFPLGPNIQTVGLPADGYDPPAGIAVSVVGWGEMWSGWYPDEMQRVDLQVLDRSVCQEDLGWVHDVTVRMLCVGQDPHGVCLGDSGSPLVHNRTQLGTVSWGWSDCTGPGAVYGNVGSVRAWVGNVTGA